MGCSLDGTHPGFRGESNLATAEERGRAEIELLHKRCDQQQATIDLLTAQRDAAQEMMQRYQQTAARFESERAALDHFMEAMQRLDGGQTFDIAQLALVLERRVMRCRHETGGKTP